MFHTGYQEAVIKCHTIINVKICHRTCKEATVIQMISIKWVDPARMYSFII